MYLDNHTSMTHSIREGKNIQYLKIFAYPNKETFKDVKNKYKLIFKHKYICYYSYDLIYIIDVYIDK